MQREEISRKGPLYCLNIMYGLVGEGCTKDAFVMRRLLFRSGVLFWLKMHVSG